MRIGLDARNTGRPGGTGIATYANNLAEACELAGYSPQWVDDTEGLSTNAHTAQRRLSRLLRSARSVCTLSPSPNGYIGKDLYRTAEVRDRLRLGPPLKVRNDCPPSIMHWTCPLPLTWPSIPNVVTIHDIIPLSRPDLCAGSSTKMRRRLKQCCDTASAIVTVSEAVKKDIISNLSVPSDKIFNLSQSVSIPDSLLEEARRSPRICDSDGFLYFGLLESRKNIGRLIRAHGLSGSRRPLVLIGARSFGAPEELAALEHHPEPARVHIHPWCNRPSLIKAISEARCVVFPSLAEGFGLPIAEAMTLGTPVITSKGHATEEISGASSLLVNPYDIKEMANALSDIDRDDTLVKQLSDIGRIRAQAFSVDAYSKRLGAFYEHIAGWRL